MSITSTVASVVHPSPSPPATTMEGLSTAHDSSELAFGWHGWEVPNPVLPLTFLHEAEECVGDFFYSANIPRKL